MYKVLCPFDIARARTSMHRLLKNSNKENDPSRRLQARIRKEGADKLIPLGIIAANLRLLYVTSSHHPLSLLVQLVHLAASQINSLLVLLVDAKENARSTRNSCPFPEKKKERNNNQYFDRFVFETTTLEIERTFPYDKIDQFQRGDNFSDDYYVATNVIKFRHEIAIIPFNQ